MRRLAIAGGFLLLSVGSFLTLELLLSPEHRWGPVSHHMGLVTGPTVAAVGWALLWLCREGPAQNGGSSACGRILAAGLFMLALPLLVIVAAALSGSELLWFSAPLLIVFVGVPGLVVAAAGAARRRRERAIPPTASSRSA